MYFQPTSRYFAVKTTTYTYEDGRKIAYLRRRLIPALDRFMPLQEHLMTEGERVDNITARYLGDAEQFWRLCDANPVMHPAELEEPGRRIRITLPEGIPGTPYA